MSQKRFDFALVTKGSSHVAAIVELDDKTHMLSSFTSIEREANGDYVVTGWDGQDGFVWICDYDPATKTLTVKESR